MKKIFTVAAMLVMALTMAAQEKPTVLIEAFQNPSNASDIIANKLRQEIVSGLMATGRLDISDASTLSALPTDKNDRMIALNEAGIQYALSGVLNTLTQNEKTTSDGKKQYEAEINYTLVVVETETGFNKATETFKDSYLVGETADDAIVKAVEKASKRMKRFVDNNFKTAATIKALDQVDPKKGVKTCYISIGSDMGIAKGQIFEVFVKQEVAGEQIDQKIGEVRVSEVKSGSLSLCDVKTGGLEIKKFFDAQASITVVSRAKKQLLGGFSSLLE